MPTGHQRPPRGEARLGFLQAFGELPTWLPLWGRYVPVGRCPAADRGGRRECPRRGRRGPTPSCPRAEDGKMALLGSNPHKTWVFEQCHVALFVEIALLLYFKLLKQTPSENRFLWFELCHSPLNCAMWHCSQSRINTGFFANSAKFSSQAVGGARREMDFCKRSPLSMSPRRRLYQRAAHALGGVTGERGENLRGIEDAIKKPPARVSYGKQSTGLFSYFPALADATKTVGRCPTTRQLSFEKAGQRTLPAYGADVR